MAKTINPTHPYDVAISFAGEDRQYVDELAAALQRNEVVVFYDAYAKAELWGKNLYTHLSDIYKNRAAYCIMLLSKHYAQKLWTNHEREAAQARAFEEHREYILPVRLDDTEIPGILPTTGYLSWPPENADSIAQAVLSKLRTGQTGTLPAANTVEKTLADCCELILDYAYDFDNGKGRTFFFWGDLVRNYYYALEAFQRDGTLTRNIDCLVSNLPRKEGNELDDEMCRAALDQLVAKGHLATSAGTMLGPRYEITALGRAHHSAIRLRRRSSGDHA